MGWERGEGEGGQCPIIITKLTPDPPSVFLVEAQKAPIRGSGPLALSLTSGAPAYIQYPASPAYSEGVA